MSDDENDQELLDLLRQSLGIGPRDPDAPPETRVLESAQYICDNSIDVALDMQGTRDAASVIWKKMQAKSYSTKRWREHELHPQMMDDDPEAAANFIFTMDLLNFCFWSYKGEDERFAVEYKGKKWKGYSSLVAALQRGIEEGIPITSPSFWHDENECTEEVYRKLFRSATEEQIPLFDKRVVVLQEAAEVLCRNFEGSVVNLIERANHSAAALVNLLAEHFPCFRDEMRFEGRTVRFLKRAQIFVADLWAAFNGEGLGRFDDIDKITMFADYRIPQILHTIGCMLYSPPLERDIRKKISIKSKSTWEVELRGCSIWCVEMIRKEIIRQNPDAKVNAILIDFFLYDTMKELEISGEAQIPHHRTRSIWY
ncbi:hypothetical protein EJ08DRAFT_197269 [Tothia fuscella]|uniref:Queuosine 5'-phosphate N-glycosylase/hydrolase n=1 Tax=Tothia fuscella TaxID=1048955 RepID=A0A9P4NTE7_9PEZI|nr:hypothetical protein EJ08DRAFT_197269 [Tothia fuscella]